MAWNDVASGACFDPPPPADGDPSPGASLFVPFQLRSGRIHDRRRCAWPGLSGQTDLRIGKDPCRRSPQPPAPNLTAPGMPGASRHQRPSLLLARPLRRTAPQLPPLQRLLLRSTLPPEVIEAVAANLTILKSPTVLRQTDGRLWAWEGCGDNDGCCHGSCTHVWNYAQAIPHLFPHLERTLRETEFGPSQNDAGHQTFRSALPIRPLEHDFHAAADGQLGGIMKVFREWRISGDTAWLRALWPQGQTES